MLIKISKNDFQQVFDIMENSFPTDEYRPFYEQKDLFLAYKIVPRSQKTLF